MLQNVDFSPLMNLIMNLLPLILTLVLIGVIVGVLSKMGKLSWSVFFLLIITLGLMSPLMLIPSTAATISPDSGTVVMGLPCPFTTDGITAATACHVNVSVGGSTTTAIATITSNDDGEISFTLIFTQAGSTTVSVGEGAKGSGTNIQTAQLDVQDMIGTIVTYVVVLVEIIAVFAIVGIIVSLFRKVGS